jgi:hypothetical protein
VVMFVNCVSGQSGIGGDACDASMNETTQSRSDADPVITRSRSVEAVCRLCMGFLYQRRFDWTVRRDGDGAPPAAGAIAPIQFIQIAAAFEKVASRLTEAAVAWS